jgi:hypothetical protein
LSSKKSRSFFVVKGVPTFFADRFRHANAGSRNTRGVNRQSKWALKIGAGYNPGRIINSLHPRRSLLKNAFHNVN